MHMCIETILLTACMVFGITIVGFFLGKFNKFGDSDELLDLSEEEQTYDDDTNLDAVLCNRNDIFYDFICCMGSYGEKEQRADRRKKVMEQ